MNWYVRAVAADLRKLWTWLRHDRTAVLANAHQHEERLRHHLHAEAERIHPDRRLDLYGKPWGGQWPADLCACPPCDPEDGWICVTHKTQPRGRHRLRLVTDRSDAEL